MMNILLQRSILPLVILVLFYFQVTPGFYINYAIGYFLLFSLCLLGIWEGRKNDFKLNLYSIFALLFLFYLILSLSWTVQVARSLHFMVLYSIPAFMILAQSFSDKPLINYDHFIKGFVFVGFLTSLYAINQAVTNTGIHEYAANYPFYNSNGLGVFLGLYSIICAFYAITNQDKNFKIILPFLLIIGVTALMTTYSRGAIVGLFITQIFLMACLWRHYLKSSLIVLGLMIGTYFIFPIILQFFVAQQQDFEASAGLQMNSGMYSGRLLIWTSAIQSAISTHPIIGNGVGTFSSIYTSFRNAADRTTGMHAHNDILHLWVELGVIGTSLIALLGIALMKQGYHIMRKGVEDKLLPLALILFVGIMANITTVIVVPITMYLLSIFICAFCSNVDYQASQNKFISNILIVIITLALFLVPFNALQYYHQDKVQNSMVTGELSRTIDAIESLDTFSFGLNPAVPLLRATIFIDAIKGGQFDASQNEAAISEVSLQLEKARHVNKYNPETEFLRAELELIKGNIEGAKNAYKQALVIDPRFAKARLALFHITEDQVEKQTILEKGIALTYWKYSPETLYREAMKFGSENGLDDLKKQATRKMSELAEQRIKDIVR